MRVKPSNEGESRSRATVTYSAAVDARTRRSLARGSPSRVTGAEVCKAGEDTVFQIKVTNTGYRPGPADDPPGPAFRRLAPPAGAKIETALANLPAGRIEDGPAEGQRRRSPGCSGARSRWPSTGARTRPPRPRSTSSNQSCRSRRAGRRSAWSAPSRYTKSRWRIPAPPRPTRSPCTPYCRKASSTSRPATAPPSAPPNRAVVWKAAGACPGRDARRSA